MSGIIPPAGERRKDTPSTWCMSMNTRKHAHMEAHGMTHITSRTENVECPGKGAGGEAGNVGEDRIMKSIVFARLTCFNEIHSASVSQSMSLE